MSARFLLCVLGLVAVPSIAAEADLPQPLVAQIERTVQLLRDSYATEYPDARMVQRTRGQNDEPVTLVVFTIEGFGGGNNHAQYLAAFEAETDREGEPHYRLLDVIPIGGKGWRAVEALNARTTHDPRSQETVFTLDVMENGPDDAMNSPSIKAVVLVKLKKGRLVEVPAAGGSD
jgi:hypothetical protein